MEQRPNEYKDVSSTEHNPEMSTAARIREKREQQRIHRMLQVKHAIILILFIFSVGLTCYAVSEFSMPWISHQGRNASAGEIIARQNKQIYDGFAQVAKTGLTLSLPGKIGDVIAVGFHEAERKDAVWMQPVAKFYGKETTSTVRAIVLRSQTPVLFVMNTRARGSAPTSAIDIVMQPGSEVLSPVDGVVTKVATYNLYGKVTDYHVEIQPDGFTNLHIAIIHIENVTVAVGDRVQRRQTPIGMMRPLPEIQSQVNKYLPQQEDHVHIQVNPTSSDVRD